MGWYINVDTGAVRDFPLFPPGRGTPWTGPPDGFPTKAAALAAEGGKPSGGGGGKPQDWWIEYVVAGGGSGGEAVPEIVQAAAAPKAGGDIEWVFGPYASKAAAQATLSKGPPSTSPVSSRGLTDNSSSNGGLNAIGDFVDRLGQASTWLRVGEVVLGIVLLAIGVARITGTANAVSTIVKARIP